MREVFSKDFEELARFLELAKLFAKDFEELARFLELARFAECAKSYEILLGLCY